MFRKSEAKFRALFDSSRDALILLNRIRFLDCNAACVELYGYSKEELLTKHPGDLSPPTQPDGKNSFLGAQELIHAAYAVGSQAFEWVHVRSDGSEFPAEVVLSRVELGGRAILHASVRDISERKELEKEAADIIEFEKRRLEQSLNNDLCHKLVAGSLEAKAIAGRLEGVAADEAEAIRQLAGTLLTMGESVRSIATKLIPSQFFHREFPATLRDLAAYVERVFQIPCCFDCTLPLVLKDRKVASQLFHIAQEALLNAAKHSRASSIRTSLTYQSGVMRLKVSDDGIGFSPGMQKNLRAGIHIMLRRAEQIGASLSFSSGPADKGTEVVCALRLTARNVSARYLETLQNDGPRTFDVAKLTRAGLTRRECEVLHWIIEGKRDGEIASILAISLRTVNHHVSSILGKLDAETRTAAVKRAVELLE